MRFSGAAAAPDLDLGIKSPDSRASNNHLLAKMLWDHHKVGFLDEMFDIFDSHKHPVVLVEGEALRWMAVGLCTGEVS
jgi:hypothetical protein